MPDYRIVLRPISIGETSLQSGEVVDVSGWRNLQSLEKTGRIDTESIVPPSEKKPVAKATKTPVISQKEVADHVDQ